MIKAFNCEIVRSSDRKSFTVWLLEPGNGSEVRLRLRPISLCAPTASEALKLLEVLLKPNLADLTEYAKCHIRVPLDGEITDIIYPKVG